MIKKKERIAGTIIVLVGSFIALATISRAESRTTSSCPIPPEPQSNADYFIPIRDDNHCVVGWVSKFFPEPDPCPPEANPTNCGQYCPECPTPPPCPDCPQIGEAPCQKTQELSFGTLVMGRGFHDSPFNTKHFSYPVTNIGNRVLAGRLQLTSIDHDTGETIYRESQGFSMNPNESRFIGFRAWKYDYKTTPYHYIIELVMSDGSITFHFENIINQ